MASHNELGRTGERIAAEYLQREGFRIIGRNYVYRKAEIDLLAIDRDLLVAVEVKTRSKCTVGKPQDFVSADKIRLMLLAVNEFVRERDIDAEIRLDIIAVNIEGKGYRVEHLRDAFYHF